MIVDCAILGGGPAGLNAALVLGRAKRSVIVFDDNQPRNAVTQETHGFLTRDGVSRHLGATTHIPPRQSCLELESRLACLYEWTESSQ